MSKSNRYNSKGESQTQTLYPFASISMCKTKTSTDVIEPNNSSSRIARTSEQSQRKTSEARRSSKRSSGGELSTSSNFTSPYYNATTGSTSYNYKDSSWQSSVSSATSLSTFRESLPENPHIYDLSEICSATNNFLANTFYSSSSSASWRCQIRGNDVLVFQRKFRRLVDTEELRERLSLICKSHHTTLVKLRGASVSGNYIYLVYDYVHGANLADCLRNPKNPNFTVLSNWMSRMKIATDLAHGLDYIHHCTGLSSKFVHNHIKTSSIIVSEPSLTAKICHFGTAELCGEIARDAEGNASKLERSDSRMLRFEGTRGYMSPEFQSTGIATQKSDVFAFGLVILELLSGKEPLKYVIDDEGGGYKRVSVIDTAREAVDGDGGGPGWFRMWVDRRLKDSFPAEAAKKMARVGLDCVEEDPGKRPDMGRIAGRISKLYLESKTWADKLGTLPSDFTVSLAAR